MGGIVRRTTLRKLDGEGPGMNAMRDGEGAGKPPVNNRPAPSLALSLVVRLFGGMLELFGGRVDRLRARFYKRERLQPRLALLERVALAPRQSLALVEAEGRRFLVATSTEGGPVFYALDSNDRPPRPRSPRVSW
jgi:hypothetical protein